MKISTRYGLDILFLLSAASLTACAMALAPAVTSWVAFGVAAAMTLIALGSAMLTRSTSRKVGHSVIALVGLATVIMALLFTGGALIWIVFGLAVALGVAAIGDLTAHELTTERVVHQLEVTGIETRRAPTGRSSA